MNWFDVEVTIDGETFTDGIQGENAYEAWENARDNWEYAEKIIILGC